MRFAARKQVNVAVFNLVPFQTSSLLRQLGQEMVHEPPHKLQHTDVQTAAHTRLVLYFRPLGRRGSQQGRLQPLPPQRAAGHNTGWAATVRNGNLCADTSRRKAAKRALDVHFRVPRSTAGRIQQAAVPLPKAASPHGCQKGAHNQSATAAARRPPYVSVSVNCKHTRSHAQDRRTHRKSKRN